MAIIQGVYDWGNHTSDEKVRDVLNRLLKRTILRDKAPFGYLALNSVKKQKTTNVKYEWALQDRTNIDRTLATGTHNTIVTTLNVTSGTATRFTAGDVLRNVRTGELLLVTADPTLTTALTVSRGFGGSTAAAMVAGDQIHAQSKALGDAADSPTATFTQEGWLYNYCQIMAETVEDTLRAMEQRRYTGETLNEQKDQALERAMRKWDQSIFFGYPSAGATATAGYRTTTGGIIYYIDADATNSWSVGGHLTWNALKEKSYDIFLHGSSTKVAYCGKTVFLALNNMAEDLQFRTTSETVSKLGLGVTKLDLPTGGTLLLKIHPLWNLGADAQRMVIVDHDDITFRYFTGGKGFRWEKIDQDNNPRVKKWELSMDAGLQYGDVQRHYHAYGITGYAAG